MATWSAPPVETSSIPRIALDAMLANSSEAIVVADSIGLILYVSPGCELLLGLDAQAALETNIFDYVHPDDLERAAQVFDHRLTYSGADTGSEIRARHGGGYWMSTQVTARPFEHLGTELCAFTLHNLSNQPAVERSLRRRIAVEELMNNLATSFITARTPEETIDRVEHGLGRVALLTGAHAASVWLEKDERGTVERYGRWARPGSRFTPPAELTKAGNEPLIEDLFSASWTVQADEVAAGLSRPAETCRTIGASSMISEPFTTGSRRGFLMLGRWEHGPDWTPEDSLMVRGCARLVGQALRAARSEALLAHVYNRGPHAVSIRTVEGSFVDCNGQYLDYFGFTEQQAQRMNLTDVLHPSERQRIPLMLQQLHASEIDQVVEEVRVVRGDGESRWMRANAQRLDDPGGHETLVLTTLEDITASRRQRDELDTQRRRLERLIDNVPALILRVDRNHNVLLCGPEVERIGRVHPEDLVGQCMLDFIAEPALRKIWADSLDQVFDEGVMVTHELRVPTSTRQLVLDARAVPEFEADGSVQTALVVALDVTDRRKIADQLLHAATHDSLTGVANREALFDRIDGLSERQDATPSLLIIDLDRFKLVNDSMGHAAGDEVLICTAERIADNLRDHDMVARLGGDEFAVVVPGISPGQLTAMAERIRVAVEQPFVIEGRSIPQSISIGAALGEHGLEAAELLVRADRALYAAKAKGRNQSVVFDESLRDEVLARLALERELRHAIDHDELGVYFQPEFSLDRRAVIGAEALMRWHHPRLGILAADDFIDVAEASGLIVEIGRITLRAACEGFAQVCADIGRSDLTLRVNISAQEFARRELTDLVRDALASSAIRADQLCLEMTETTLMDSPEIALETFGRLHELGVQFAIDDFGTGYSSLTYLKRFPVDAVKIDRSFVEDITRDPDSLAIVESIIGLATALDLEVVAEGVENEEQARLLRRLGCERAQGYLLSGALSAPDFVRLLGS